MKRIFFCLCYFFMISTLNAKTEIDKAFKFRGMTNSSNFILYSPDTYDGKEIREEQVYDKFGCNGKNLSPKLVWSGVPAGTKSFAITMYDKDAPTGSGWWHWIIYDIPFDITSIPMGINQDKKLLTKVNYGINDYGEKDYGGVCPPPGSKHNYIITIYALNVEELDLPRNATAAMIGLYLNNHMIKTATIKTFYRRKVGVTYRDNSSSNKKLNSDKNIKYKLNSEKKSNLNNKINNRNNKNNVNVVVEKNN